MSTTLKSGVNTPGLANVDATFNLKVNTPIDELDAGYVAIAACHDDGDVTGTRDIKEVDISSDYRLRVAIDNMIFNDIFPGTVINTSKWAAPSATATVAQASGFLTLNNGGSLVSAQGSILKSWKTFPVYSAFGIYLEIRAAMATLSFENVIVEWGFAITVGTVANAPTDGIFFRYQTSGLSCVIVNNNVELANVPISNATLLAGISAAFSMLNSNHYIIFVDDDSCEFWVDDVLIYAYNLANTILPVITSSQAMYVYGRVYNTNTNGLIAQKLAIASVNVSIADMESGINFSDRIALAQESACLAPSNGASTGSTLTAGITNAALPAVTATLSIAAAPGTVGLGGYNRALNATGQSLTADSAWIVFSYAVPAALSTLPGKTLLISAWDISIVSRAVIGSNAGLIPVIVEMNFGCTNVSPATAENIATQTTPVKGVRRLIIGNGSVPINCPIGSVIANINWRPAEAIACEAGTFVQITIRPLVTWVLANSQDIVFTASPIGCWV